MTARDLAVMGATLANTGMNPFTGESIFDVHCVQDTLSVMFTCGMYDYSGEWAFRVGVPAKSGVGGGIMGVVNRQLGIGSYVRIGGIVDSQNSPAVVGLGSGTHWQCTGPL